VLTLTLDSLALRNVSFLKIDVQGADDLLLYGARETILREKPVINLEDSAFWPAKMKTAAMIRLLQMPEEVRRTLSTNRIARIHPRGTSGCCAC
jgi:hypothetical protein